MSEVMQTRSGGQPVPSGSTDSSGPPLIEARDVGRVFVSGGIFGHKETFAVDGVDMVFPSDRPRIISLIGESGSGKTTLARMILRLTQPTSGNVFFQGKNIAKLSGRDWKSYRKEVQAVFQDPYGIYNTFYRVDRVMRITARKFKLASTPDAEQALIEEALHAVDLRPNDVLGTLSASAQRRRAPARDAGSAVHAQAAPGRRRRAGVDDRRRRPGAVPEYPAGLPGQARHLDAVHHPQPRDGELPRGRRRRAIPWTGLSRKATSTTSSTRRSIPTPRCCCNRCRSPTRSVAGAWTRSWSARRPGTCPVVTAACSRSAAHACTTPVWRDSQSQ